METATPEVELPDCFTATSPVTPEIRNALRVADAVALAESFVIEDAVTADLANRELRGIKARLKELEEKRVALVKPLRTVIDGIQALFRPPMEALEESERVLKRKLGDWTAKEQARIEDERRQREAAERAARQKAEQEAAAARARAEAEAAEARRKAEEAEAARQKAEAEGNAKAAAAAAAQAARLQEKAAAIAENGEAKAMGVQAAAVAAAPAPVVAAAVPKGFGLRDNWTAELEPGKTEADAKALIVAAIAGGRADLLPLLSLDMKAATQLAKALKSAMAVPGLKAINRQIAASRGK